MSDTDGEIDNLTTTDDWGITTSIVDDVDQIAVKTTQDVAPILEANNEEYNSGHSGNLPGGWGRKVASIPLGVVMTWKEKYGVDVFNKNHMPAVARLLNSSEWRYLRTAPGMVGLGSR